MDRTYCPFKTLGFPVFACVWFCSYSSAGSSCASETLWTVAPGTRSCWSSTGSTSPALSATMPRWEVRQTPALVLLLIARDLQCSAGKETQLTLFKASFSIQSCWYQRRCFHLAQRNAFTALGKVPSDPKVGPYSDITAAAGEHFKCLRHYTFVDHYNNTNLNVTFSVIKLFDTNLTTCCHVKIVVIFQNIYLALHKKTLAFRLMLQASDLLFTAKR